MKHASDYITKDDQAGRGYPLTNPWTHKHVGYMTWGDIIAWSRDHIADADRYEWRKAADKATDANDADTLGAMILGA